MNIEEKELDKNQDDQTLEQTQTPQKSFDADNDDDDFEDDDEDDDDDDDFEDDNYELKEEAEKIDLNSIFDQQKKKAFDDMQNARNDEAKKDEDEFSSNSSSYTGSNSDKKWWQDDEDHIENSVKIVELIDSLSTKALQKFFESWVAQNKKISDIIKIIDNFEAHKKAGHPIEMNHEEYVKALKAYVILYTEDIPMPNSLKKSLMILIKDQLKKYFKNNPDSPIAGVILAFSTWSGTLAANATAIRSKMMDKPEVDNSDIRIVNDDDHDAMNDDIDYEEVEVL